MARIVSVYTPARSRFAPVDMSFVRWWKIAEALAERGHQVDLASNEPIRWWRRFVAMGLRLRRVPLARVRWSDYDVVKTEFHMGFTTLEQYGGADHPFIISKLGSLVDSRDREGVYFYGAEREKLFRIQERIDARSRYVTLLTRESQTLWQQCFQVETPTLLVPGAVDECIPEPGTDPYGDAPRPRCLFLGNIYDPHYQPEVHRCLADRLDQLGSELNSRGIRLYFVGPGDTSHIDPDHVHCVGAVPYAQSWAFMQHADVSVVLAFGAAPNHNESTKIYHYLRVGLPTVCESGFPNQGLIEEAGLGMVTPNGSMSALADAVAMAARADWDRARAIECVCAAHTWRKRAEVYGEILRRHGLE